MNTGQVVSLFQMELNNNSIDFKAESGSGLTTSSVIGNSFIIMSLSSDTSDYQKLRMFKPLQFANLTTTERDASVHSPDVHGINNGAVIFNTTTNKLQVRVGSSWIDLH